LEKEPDFSAISCKKFCFKDVTPYLFYYTAIWDKSQEKILQMQVCSCTRCVGMRVGELFAKSSPTTLQKSFKDLLGKCKQSKRTEAPKETCYAQKMPFKN
jgi:hypothetical protein